MAEKKIADIMRDFVQTMAKGDVEKTLSFFTEDAVWVNPNGTFKGKDKLRHYFSAFAKSVQGMTVTETGNGIIEQGNKAFFEHIIAGTCRGRKIEALAMCAYEFKGDKIQHIRTTLDRLLLAQQSTSGLLKIIVNQIVKQSEKLFR